MVREVPILNAYKVNCSFSRDGKYFALFRRKVNVLQIYKIDETENRIEGLLDKITKEDYFKQYEKIDVLKHAQKMVFDINSETKYLVCYGKHIFNIINLEGEEGNIKTEKIDLSRFKCIMDIQLSSSGVDTYRCDLACLKITEADKIAASAYVVKKHNVVIYTADEEIDMKK